MILQLPNGRIIELSTEEYLSMSDEDIKNLNTLGDIYTKDCLDPFYNLYSIDYIELDDEDDLLDNRNDPYFFDNLN